MVDDAAFNVLRPIYPFSDSFNVRRTYKLERAHLPSCDKPETLRL